MFKLAYLFISHDLSVVRHIADEVMVMYLGRPAEQGDKETIFARPRHPYTKALLASTPAVDPKARAKRIVFARRTALADRPSQRLCVSQTLSLCHPECAAKRPELRRVDGRMVACHYAEMIIFGLSHMRHFCHRAWHGRFVCRVATGKTTVVMLPN